MRYLFIFRHGPHDRTGYLTPDGKEMMDRVGRYLARAYRLEPESTKVICSHELRALKTAQALSLAALGVSDEECFDELFSNDRTSDIRAALKVIGDMRAYHAVIVVTHYELSGELPASFGKEAFETDDFPLQPLENGYGYAIDCEKETCVLIDPNHPDA